MKQMLRKMVVGVGHYTELEFNTYYVGKKLMQGWSLGGLSWKHHFTKAMFHVEIWSAIPLPQSVSIKGAPKEPVLRFWLIWYT